MFAPARPAAEPHHSGDLDFFDFLCFQNAFEAGCPWEGAKPMLPRPPPAGPRGGARRIRTRSPPVSATADQTRPVGGARPPRAIAGPGTGAPDR